LHNAGSSGHVFNELNRQGHRRFGCLAELVDLRMGLGRQWLCGCGVSLVARGVDFANTQVRISHLQGGQAGDVDSGQIHGPSGRKTLTRIMGDTHNRTRPA